MNKTGLVLKSGKKYAVLATSSGEFVKVSISSIPPHIGETYTGSLKSNQGYIRKFSAIAAIFLICLFGGALYEYFTPYASVKVSINPSLELKINRFDRILSCLPLNSDGKTLLKNMNLNNENIDTALTLIVEEAKKDNFINTDYIKQGKTISIQISCNNHSKTIDINNFQKYIAKNKINISINNNGKEIKREFNKKIPQSNDLGSKTNTDNNSSSNSSSNNNNNKINNQNDTSNKADTNQNNKDSSQNNNQGNIQNNSDKNQGSNTDKNNQDKNSDNNSNDKKNNNQNPPDKNGSHSSSENTGKAALPSDKKK